MTSTDETGCAPSEKNQTIIETDAPIRPRAFPAVLRRMTSIAVSTWSAPMTIQTTPQKARF
jgi:hypothetical protein